MTNEAKIISGIYQIKCLLNNKIYIGSSNKITLRINTHKSRLRNNKHHSPHLQSAWNKYGENNFIFEVIEEVDESILLEREQFYIDIHKSYLSENGFNINHIAGRTIGKLDSEETKMKKAKARKTWSFTEETKKRMSENAKGRIISQSTREKMSKNGKGICRKRLSLKLTKDGVDYFVKDMKQCLELLQIPSGSRTTIYQVICGKRESINGFKITNMR